MIQWKIILNNQNVAFTDFKCLIGNACKNLAGMNPTKIIFDAYLLKLVAEKSGKPYIQGNFTD
ncbi:hypothetical protein PIROE2DRAFT_17147 [Piromyces sp. E2]|nr:hypothetical protein PIROE2DRAFT_17147 [Piromyces sp. E2]|eukprot:OUM57758.1 hypothetical protein PIROE2DRAFT_17147 [Piromyces sp. E2]